MGRHAAVRNGATPRLLVGVYAVVALIQGVLDVLSTHVEDLTGRPPRSLRDVLEAHRSELEETA